MCDGLEKGRGFNFKLEIEANLFGACVFGNSFGTFTHSVLS